MDRNTSYELVMSSLFYISRVSFQFVSGTPTGVGNARNQCQTLRPKSESFSDESLVMQYFICFVELAVLH